MTRAQLYESTMSLLVHVEFASILISLLLLIMTKGNVKLVLHELVGW